MKKVTGFVTGLFEKFQEEDVFTLSASLAYYTALSLAPLLIILLSFLSLMGEEFQGNLNEQIQTLVGPQVALAIKSVMDHSGQRPDLGSWAGLLGAGMLLFSASAVFSQLRSSLNKIFDEAMGTPLKNEKSANVEGWAGSLLRLFLDRIFCIGMVFSFVLLTIISLVVSSIISFFITSDILARGAQYFNYAASGLVFTLLFTGIFYYIPERKLRSRYAWPAGVLTSIFFVAGKELIGIYLAKSAFATAYGAAGSLVILMTWVYYSSLIIFLGAVLAFQLQKPAQALGKSRELS